METDLREEDIDKILQLLKDINEAWLKGNLAELENLFHDEMIIAHPGSQRLGVGKEACIQSYREFLDHAEIERLTESNHMVDIWGDTAVASYSFVLDYKMDGEELHDTGSDLFVCVRINGEWRAVWRTVIHPSEMG